MTVFRANDRLPEDERFLVISSYEEFELFRERQKLGFNGLLLEAPLTGSQRQAAKDFAKKMLETLIGMSAGHIFFFLDESRFSPLQHRLTKRSIPTELHPQFTMLAQCSFHMHGHHKKQLGLQASKYSGFPPHKHSPTIVYPMTHLGTKIITPDGREITLKTEWVAAFDETVLHAAPCIPYEKLKDDPRFIAII